MNAETYTQLTGLKAYTKKEEYIRTIEMFKNIYETQGFYFAIAFLYDSGYTKEDLKELMKLTHPKNK